MNFNFSLTIQLTYSYLLSTAKSWGIHPLLALGKLRQQGRKFKASLGCEARLFQRNKNWLKSLRAGPASPSPCMFGETEPKVSPKPNTRGCSWSTRLSQSKVHMALPGARVLFGLCISCLLCTSSPWSSRSLLYLLFTWIAWGPR